MDEKAFVQEAQKYGISLTEEMCAQFRKYTELLLDWNERMNLTAITDPEEIYEKHYLDSLSLLCLEGIHGQIADVGSGAGFPGLVLAIVLPDAAFSLIDPLAKRCTFLRAASETLGLKNTTVFNERAEDHARGHRETYDAVTARAVAALPELSELCVPLVKTGGIFAPMKGNKGEEEAHAAAHALELLGCAAPEVKVLELPSAGKRVLIRCEKVRHTPKKYPRNYGQIHKHPLV